MACCCAKISRCKNDISKVSEAKSALQTLKNNNGTLDARLSELSAKMRETATPDNMDSCASSIKNLNKDSASTIDTMISRCESKITALQNDRKKYEKEDKEYHQNLKM